MSKPVAIDLFCGAGGLSEGFQQAGFKIVFGSDIDPTYLKTFEHNHPDAFVHEFPIEGLTHQKIKKKTGLKRGDLDVLVGGPPCQGFSINAPKRELQDPRNSLFVHYVRIVAGLWPMFVVMENVPGILSMGKGAVIRQIYDAFGSIGYKMSHKVLFAAHYGVSQERWRVFFIGTRLKGTPIEFPMPTHRANGRPNFTDARKLSVVFGQEELFEKLPSFVPVKDAIGDLPRLRIGEGADELEYHSKPKSNFQRKMREGSEIIYNHVAGKLGPINLERLKYIPPGGSWRDIPHELLPPGMQRARRSDHTKRYGRLDPNGLSCTILTKCDPHWGSYFLPNQDRTLTVREAARLQSFPDRFRFFGSRVSQYEQVGNAVPPLMAKALAEKVLKGLRQSS